MKRKLKIYIFWGAGGYFLYLGLLAQNWKSPYCITSVLLTFFCSMRPFWKCLIISKMLVRTILKFYPFCGNWDLISIFKLAAPKLKKPTYKLSSLTVLMVYVILSVKSDKNKLEISLFWGRLGADFNISTGPKLKKKKPQNELFQSSWSFKCIAGFLLTRRNRLWQEIQHFLNTFRVSFIGNIQDIFTCMAIQTHHIIASQKKQLKWGSCTKTGHPIKPCPLNFEIVQDAKSKATRDCLRWSKTI